MIVAHGGMTGGCPAHLDGWPLGISTAATPTACSTAHVAAATTEPTELEFLHHAGICAGTGCRSCKVTWATLSKCGDVVQHLLTGRSLRHWLRHRHPGRPRPRRRPFPISGQLDKVTIRLTQALSKPTETDREFADRGDGGVAACALARTATGAAQSGSTATHQLAQVGNGSATQLYALLATAG